MALNVRTWVLILIAIALVPGVLAATYLHIDARAELVRETREQVETAVVLRTAALEVQLNLTEEVLQKIAAAEDVATLDPQACPAYLQDVLDISTLFKRLAVVHHPTGDIECMAPEIEPPHPPAVNEATARAIAQGDCPCP
jgi:cell division protein FtsX